jgi:excinuclease ABC subunit C
LHLVQQIRDEAHRFAVTFHRHRRDTSRLRNELTVIKGIGPETVKKLLREFGSVTDIKDAAEEALAKSIGPVAARRIKEHYREDAAAIS